MESAVSFSWKGLLRLACIVAGLILFFGFISPCLVALSPAHTLYGEVQNIYGVHSGSLYYTDQPTLAATQTQVRRALLVSGHVKAEKGE